MERREDRAVVRQTRIRRDALWKRRPLVAVRAQVDHPGPADLLRRSHVLDLGAAVGAADASGRTPLFGVANECRGASGSAVTQALLRRGAAADARDRVKRCTPLHAAARRGSVAVAAALLTTGWRPGAGAARL